jgi:probable HAF family extracellular repeat protein
MTKQPLKNAVLSAGLLGLALSTSISLAQVGLASKLPGKRPPSAAALAASHQAKTPEAPSYTYTVLSFPGTLLTYPSSMNLGATTAKIDIVGGYGANVLAQGGFLVRLSGTKTVTETYKAVNDPHAPQDQLVSGVNDSGQIVGISIDSSDHDHGYELSGGKFTTLNYPRSTYTFPEGINNSGEVVGFWGTDAGSGGSFTLIGGTYAAFNYSGAAPGQTFALGVNSNGEIVGWYNDTSGVSHGFLLSGGTYTSFDPPGSVSTIASGINDAGDIVGGYCTTSECISTGEGGLGFLLSNGVFTTITIPGESYTEIDGINNKGVLLGQYTDAAGIVYSFLATP